ncbi:L,D-transpeptidase family protein [Ciceribacter ferrooxidans]|uniref:Peptidoglycan-binding protein n=1 Tax=Ciceribacter ferrooxidans TaxID=2509717 RepID=A0A4Q2T5G2_9HYPH|nr:L,D-transpeptidase family protein [Ciceribacter ferrooxidans]RYC12214.1 peptidoglycan-binding protein [Ciceribacter ferrooxidans]
MTRYKTIALTAVFAAFTALSTAPRPAAAITLLDMLRGGPGADNRQRGNDTFFGRRLPGVSDPVADPEPLPKVSGPRYYTYKPEATRPVTITAPAMAAAQPAVTGSDASTTASIAPVDPQLEQRRLLSETKSRAPDDIAAAVEAYYNAGRPLIWVSENGMTERARSALATFAEADLVGLVPEDYLVAAPAEAAADADPLGRQRELMAFELSMSIKALTYVGDTVRGRVDPNKLSGYHDIKRKTVNFKPVLNMMRLSPDVGAYLKSRMPANPQFQALQAELVRLKAEQSDPSQTITIAPGTLLKPGVTNPELANVIAAIKLRASEALKTEHAATLAAYTGTPEYTPELVALVEGFQKESGLHPDGVVGKATIRTLMGDSNAAKIEKLVVAMEELRWLPADLGSRYVFINQPAFTAYYVNEGRPELSMRVVVGSKANQTYFFNDQIETVEFNPYWGVPKSIIINEMLPKLRQDPGYLDRLGYEVSYGGRKVSSSAVDWNSTHNVDVRQPPGSDNALGELKILFPNAHSIYMHDTPSKSFFKRDMRALSHGCVRLAEPRRMAAAVMGTTVEDIGAQIAAGQNRAVQVPQKIPVYVSYFTAWPNKDGVIEYFDDVYGRDEYTRKAFAVTSEARSARS